MLLPEDIAGPAAAEPMDGPSPTLMALKAKQYGMNVAGGFLLRQAGTERTYNVCALFGRTGELIGLYRKNHLYVTELLSGITPGDEVPVFDTDFGKVGIITCYDSFFTDVIELEALKGAEIVLFPSAGYYRSLMPARASDNGVRIVASSWGQGGAGMWDTSGADVKDPDADESRCCNCEGMFGDVLTQSVDGTDLFTWDAGRIHRLGGKMEMLCATFDLSKSAPPHHRSGPMASGPGGHRNRRGQRQHLLDEIKREYSR